MNNLKHKKSNYYSYFNNSNKAINTNCNYSTNYSSNIQKYTMYNYKLITHYNLNTVISNFNKFLLNSTHKSQMDKLKRKSHCNCNTNYYKQYI